MPHMPGWNSIDVTTRVHDFCEFWGIALFLIVVVLEFGAYFYGHRRDWLMGESARIAGIERQNVEKATEQRHAAEATALRQQVTEAQNAAAEAKKNAAEIQALHAPRHLTDAEKTELKKFITENSKGSASFTIKASASENDARAYADEIAAFFNATPISWHVHVDNAMIMGTDTSGIWMSIKDRNAIPLAAGLLHSAFVKAGLPIKKDVEIDPGIPGSDEIWLSIGGRK